MAIDTENKRRSVQAYWLGLARPVPDGTISEGDRATSAWLYSGIDYSVPSLGSMLSAQFHKLFNLHHNIPGFS